VKSGLSSDILPRSLSEGEHEFEGQEASQRLSVPLIGQRTVFSNRAQPARDAERELRCLRQSRGKESQLHQRHGGNLPVGLSV
jgi:hypothetical protein